MIRRVIYKLTNNIARIINFFFYNFYKLFRVDKELIVFESEGDCCDNAYAFYNYINNDLKLTKYKIVWLVDHPKSFANSGNVIYIYKNDNVINYNRSKALATCRYYIFDHCNLYITGRFKYKSRREQNIVYLGHGCGFKAVKPIKGIQSNITRAYVTGRLYIDLIAEAQGCSKDVVKDLGYPRLDYFFKSINEIQKDFMSKHNFEKFKRIILWMPTFRRSNNMAFSEEYFTSHTGLPIIETEDALTKFDEYLKRTSSLCIFKIHHLQASLQVFKKEFSNVIILRDEELTSMGLQLYQAICLTDLLITDYSSIFNDYMLLDKPIIYTLDDYEAYKQSRGFKVADPLKYLIGHHVYNERDLYNAIDDIIENGDTYKDERKHMIYEMHSHINGKSCERIVNDLKLLGD